MRSGRLSLVLAVLSCLAWATAPASAADLPTLVRQQAAPQRATALLLDVRTGGVLASTGPERRALPGSTLKPLLLEYALEHGLVRAETAVYCRRNLRIGRRALFCTHPADQTLFRASSALAASCNTWFAGMAERFPGPALNAAFEQAKLPHADLAGANVAERQLAVLGLQGVTATPTELARAYRELLLHMPRESAVASGLANSVRYGMARGAGVPGLEVLGKTGTASDPGETWTHGWFVGVVPGRWVLVVYVPHGDGGTAAGIAGQILRAAAAAPPGTGP